MEHNDESLSTRDLASPDDLTTGGVSSPEAEAAVSSSSSSAGTVAPPSEVQTPSEDETGTGPNEPLLAPELSVTFQRRWEEVQTRFVDEPRGAVEDADGLVANLMPRVSGFSGSCVAA